MTGKPKAELIEWLGRIAIDMPVGWGDIILNGTIAYRDDAPMCDQRGCRKEAIIYRNLYPWCAGHEARAKHLCSRDGCKHDGDYWNCGKRLCWDHKIEAKEAAR